MYRYIRLYAVIFFISFLYNNIVYATDRQNSYEKTTDKPLNDILEDVEFAVTEHNLRVVDRLHIGQAIKDRGKQDFPAYEVILYCSITFAEKMLELAPELINACPGRITVRGKDTSYIISAPLWPNESNNGELKKLIENMNNIVKDIVDYAALKWLNDYEE